MKPTKVNLNVNKCFTQLSQAFNRVQYFSCIIDNLKVEALPDEWKITNTKKISFNVQKPSDDKKENLVKGCKYFVQRYLVRDVIESFALSLDQLFFILFLHGKKEVPSNTTLFDCLSDKEKELQREFEEAGLFGKIEKLHSQHQLKLPSDYKQVINSLKDIRNCLAHSNGIVRPMDGQRDGKEKRKFTWMILSIFSIGTETGKKKELEFNKLLEETVNIGAEIQHYSKSFKVGDHLSFSPAETYEIGWSLDYVAKEYLKEMAKLIKAI